MPLTKKMSFRCQIKGERKYEVFLVPKSRLFVFGIPTTKKVFQFPDQEEKNVGTAMKVFFNIHTVYK